jgi:hypothetical protein
MLDLARSALEKYLVWESGQTLSSTVKMATVYIASATPGQL